MNEIEEYDVIIEYGKMELIDCLGNLLILMNENCEKTVSELEKFDSL